MYYFCTEFNKHAKQAIKNLAAKLKKIIQLTKKNEEKMKKLMFICNVIFSAILAGLAISYTIGSLVMAGWQSWHVAFIAISLLTIALVRISIIELRKCINDEK